MGMIKLPKDSVDFFKNNLDDIFSSGCLAEGDWNRSVSDWTCDYTGASYSYPVNSNGAGLFALLRILKQYKNKKRIFLQSNTMYGVKTIAITSGLELCGYVDCSLDYLMPTYQQVNDFISRLDKPQECVFLITHIGGWVNPEIAKISDICKRKGVSLIEDCAHSFGSLLNGQHTGLFGDAGVYSLYATKAIPAGEGGIVVTNNEELAHLLSKFAIYDRFDQELDIGVNIRMSEISALLAYSVLSQTEHVIENKYKIAEEYKIACNRNSFKYIDPTSNGQRSNLYKFILLRQKGLQDDEFSNISLRTSPVYDYSLGGDQFLIRENHICLPIWYKLEEKIIDQVIMELDK